MIQKVGIERLVLETDHEDAIYINSSIDECIDFLANVLALSRESVIQTTTHNALALYGLLPSSA